MTDRELLELAARAAGYVLGKHTQKDWAVTYRGMEWNPLTDDGDALRLAVKLRMFLDLDSLCAQAQSHKWFGGGDDPEAGLSPDECDPYAATRRAIVRAAAEIGRALE